MKSKVGKATHLVREVSGCAYWSVRRASASVRGLPGFLVIGAMRSGTSSLYNYLIQSRYVLPARRKEVHFFDNHYCKGRLWYQANFPTRAAATFRRLQYRQPVVAGEATPYYIFHPEAPSRIRAICPEAKLIALLRDPVDRALSHYQHSVRNGYERQSFVRAINREMAWLEAGFEGGIWAPFPDAYSHQRLSYLARGLYARQLRNWFEFFPREQLLVLSSESMFADPHRTVREVLGFLDLPDSSLQDPAARNVASYASMEADLRSCLVRFFEPHNQSLYELLGCDFGWEGT